MVEHTTGIICAPMPAEDLDRLELPLMVPSRENEEAMRTAFTVSVDARHTTSTGVSASDRCSPPTCTSFVPKCTSIIASASVRLTY